VRPLWHWLPVAGTALALLPASGCNLLVGGGGLETQTCHFQGASTTCGACVTTRCQDEVNACCLDSTCDGNLGTLDGCASTSDTLSCDFISEAALVGGSSRFASLSRCIARSCGGCLGTSGFTSPDGGSGDAATESGARIHVACTLLTDNDCFCSLQPGPAGSPPKCGPNITNPVCCADPGWPEPSDAAIQPGCSCETLGCSLNTIPQCQCLTNTEATADGDSPGCSPSWSTCCTYAGDYCYCTDDSCNGSEQTVAECTPKTLGCPTGKVLVDSCVP
jgi:hypothetical protein